MARSRKFWYIKAIL